SVSSQETTKPFLKNGGSAARKIFTYHPLMVLAVVDDLLFSSKIRAAAEHAGRPVEFVRKRGDVVGRIRMHGARLVLIDLDRESLAPIGVVEDIRAAGDLGHVRTVGFVSHVRADRIDAARRAGIGAVLARSAFVTKLPELLAGESAEGPRVPTADDVAAA